MVSSNHRTAPRSSTMHIVWAAVCLGRYRDLPSLQNVIPDGDADLPGRPVALQRYSPRDTRGLPCPEISNPRGISREHGRPGRTRRSTAVTIAEPAAVVYSLTPTIGAFLHDIAQSGPACHHCGRGPREVREPEAGVRILIGQRALHRSRQDPDRGIRTVGSPRQRRDLQCWPTRRSPPDVAAASGRAGFPANCRARGVTRSSSVTATD